MRHRPQQFLPMATTGLVTLLIALAAPLAAQDGITALYFADANGNTITQGTSANLHVSTNNVSNYSILVGPDPSTTGGYYGSSCYLSFNVTFDVSGNPIAIVTLLDQNGNYSDTSQRGQILYNYPNGTLSNGQCVINLGNSSINGGSISGNRYFNISLNMTFQSTMNGVQGVYENYSSYSSTYGQYSTNGLIWSGQNFTVGSGQPITITVSPSSAAVYQGQSKQFTAVVSPATSGTITWSISPNFGSISQAGLYTAPASVTSNQSITVTAAMQGASGSATAAASQLSYSSNSIGTIHADNQAVNFPGTFACAGYYCNSATCSLAQTDQNYGHVTASPTGGTVPDKDGRSTHGVSLKADTTAVLGTTPFSCTVQPIPGFATGSRTLDVNVTIAASPPAITGITHASGAGSTFLQAEGQVSVRINGRGFGSCGTLSVQGGSGSGVGIDNSVPSTAFH